MKFSVEISGQSNVRLDKQSLNLFGRDGADTHAHHHQALAAKRVIR